MPGFTPPGSLPEENMVDTKSRELKYLSQAVVYLLVSVSYFPLLVSRTKQIIYQVWLYFIDFVKWSHVDRQVRREEITDRINQ